MPLRIGIAGLLSLLAHHPGKFSGSKTVGKNTLNKNSSLLFVPNGVRGYVWILISTVPSQVCPGAESLKTSLSFRKSISSKAEVMGPRGALTPLNTQVSSHGFQDVSP